MSDFNQTIELDKTFLSGNGTTGTTPQKLAGVVSAKIYKGVKIKNTDAGQTLWVGLASVDTTTRGFELKPGEEVFLEIDNPADVYQICNVGGTTYSWCAY